jgi:Flp pilus assembly protein TadG
MALTRKTLALRAMRFLPLKTVRRFARKNDGAAAIEFGLVAAPFLALVFAIMETAVVFFAGQVLETAAADSGRLIMTGQAQNITDAAGFKTEVCKRIYGLFDCDGKVKVDVRKYTTKSIASADLAKPIDSSGKLKTDLTYEKTEPGDLVVVRLLYEYPVYVSLLGLNLSDMAGSKRLIMATSAFRNEPYK